jgi:hypothetical protein
MTQNYTTQKIVQLRTRNGIKQEENRERGERKMKHQNDRPGMQAFARRFTRIDADEELFFSVSALIRVNLLTVSNSFFALFAPLCGHIFGFCPAGFPGDPLRLALNAIM